MTQMLPYGGPRTPELLRDLTERERDILELVCDGFTNHEIADELGVGTGGVMKSLQAAFTKLQARNRAHAAALAIRAGIIERAA